MRNNTFSRNELFYRLCRTLSSPPRRVGNSETRDLEALTCQNGNKMSIDLIFISNEIIFFVVIHATSQRSLHLPRETERQRGRTSIITPTQGSIAISSCLGTLTRLVRAPGPLSSCRGGWERMSQTAHAWSTMAPVCRAA